MRRCSTRIYGEAYCSSSYHTQGTQNTVYLFSHTVGVVLYCYIYIEWDFIVFYSMRTRIIQTESASCTGRALVASVPACARPALLLAPRVLRRGVVTLSCIILMLSFQSSRHTPCWFRVDMRTHHREVFVYR
mgnify:CR=1 FL=1